MTPLDLPPLDALDAERARREPAQRFVLAGAVPTDAETAAIAAYHASNPHGLAIVRVIVDPPIHD